MPVPSGPCGAGGTGGWMSLTSEVLKQVDQRPVAVWSCPVTSRSREFLAVM
jgi:hypothetical protein